MQSLTNKKHIRRHQRATDFLMDRIVDQESHTWIIKNISENLQEVGEFL